MRAKYHQAECNCANSMTWPIPAILCRPSYFIAFHCIAFYCWTGQLRCKSYLSLTLSLLLLTVISYRVHKLFCPISQW